MKITIPKTEPTHLQEIIDPDIEKAGVQVYIKRDDLIHPLVSGNKWRKLKYNLIEAAKQGHNKILTFGGAFSNHIYSTAASGALYGFKTIGIIRGEETLPLNPTLEFAQSKGMEMHYISRTEYREKDSDQHINKLKDKYGDFYLVPEGGSNTLALPGVAELVREIDIPFDYICTAIGTGGTLAGLISTEQENYKALGFASLKGNGYLEEEVRSLIKTSGREVPSNWEIIHDYHFGGYAKMKKELAIFIREFETKHRIPLDPVYTSKMLYGVLDLIKKGYFEKGKTIIALHTGGLQGNAGMEQKINKLLNS